MRARPHESGVRVSAACAPGLRISTATALLDATKAATYEFDLAWTMDTELADAADVVQVGSIATWSSPTRATAAVTFDPNIRPAR